MFCVGGVAENKTWSPGKQLQRQNNLFSPSIYFSKKNNRGIPVISKKKNSGKAHL